MGFNARQNAVALAAQPDLETSKPSRDVASLHAERRAQGGASTFQASQWAESDLPSKQTIEANAHRIGILLCGAGVSSAHDASLRARRVT